MLTIEVVIIKIFSKSPTLPHSMLDLIALLLLALKKWNIIQK